MRSKALPIAVAYVILSASSAAEAACSGGSGSDPLVCDGVADVEAHVAAGSTPVATTEAIAFFRTAFSSLLAAAGSVTAFTGSHQAITTIGDRAWVQAGTTMRESAAQSQVVAWATSDDATGTRTAYRFDELIKGVMPLGSLVVAGRSITDIYPPPGYYVSQFASYGRITTLVDFTATIGATVTTYSATLNISTGSARYRVCMTSSCTTFWDGYGTGGSSSVPIVLASVPHAVPGPVAGAGLSALLGLTAFGLRRRRATTEA